MSGGCSEHLGLAREDGIKKIKKNNSNLLGVTGEPAMLELLAEECMELGHAALKLARKCRGENPTPLTRSECLMTLQEELADVLTVVDQLSGIVDMAAVDVHKEEKLERWRARVNLTSQ